AAGFARRMGRQKLLLDLRGKPVVRWSVEAILPHIADTVVVTGQDDVAVRAALDGLPVRFAVNPRPQAGQGSSIAIGAGALKPWTAAALGALGDQPRLPDGLIAALLRAREPTGRAVVPPVHRGPQGPVATSVHLALRLKKPLLIEGHAGVGKTEVAKVMARMLETNLIRLQCYEGLDASATLYEWNYQKQLLHIKLGEGAHKPVDQEE